MQENHGSLLIGGGLLVNPDRQWAADVRVERGKIVEIAERLVARTGERVIDVHGMQVLPGGIDPHAHLLPPFVDDYESGSRAALAGGITSIGSMVYALEASEVSVLDVLQAQEKLVHRQAIADIFLHPSVWIAPEQAADMTQAMVAAGHTSIKVFMVTRQFSEHADAYRQVVAAAGKAGMLTLCHCEDYAMLQESVRRLREQGKSSLCHYAESRPVGAEVKAVKDAIAMCRVTGAPVYLVHIAAGEALALCGEAKRQGLPVYVETRPIYLYFTSEKYLGADGPLYVGQPPLREAADVEALWQGITSGVVDVLGSDHAPWTREQKLDPQLDIERLRPGVADLQTMLPVFYSEGVHKRKIGLGRFVALTATNAARLFGLFPAKGIIAVGSDADLVVWDPNKTRRLRREELLSRAAFSLHEGWDIHGWPHITIRRGEVVCVDGNVTGLPGSGILPARQPHCRRTTTPPL